MDNIRIYCHDAVEILRDCMPLTHWMTVQIFFPDPWHKKRHNKRRLIQPALVEHVVTRMKPGGLLHLATDWEDYAEQMMAVLSAEHRAGQYERGAGEFSPRPEHRPLTKFERRGERLGHGVWDLVFQRLQESNPTRPMSYESGRNPATTVSRKRRPSSVVFICPSLDMQASRFRRSNQLQRVVPVLQRSSPVLTVNSLPCEAVVEAQCVEHKLSPGVSPWRADVRWR